jgi:putative heme-binding domain-containing protein
MRLADRTCPLRRLCIVAVLCAGAAARPDTTAPATPQWIWLGKDAGDREVVYFRKTFEVGSKPKRARLAATCDNEVTLFINGRRVLQNDVWEQPAGEDVTGALRTGRNVLAARCANQGGPAGFLVKLTIESADGAARAVVTDTSWKAASDPKSDWRSAGYDEAGWRNAVSLGEWGVGPWGRVELDDLRPPAATPAEEIKVATGFRVERLYSVPRSSQGSWVCMTGDPKGRLIVSDQSGSLYRVTPGESASATKVERLDVPIGQAQGLLYAYDSLYVTVNGGAAQGSGFYRVRDADGDDRFDEVKRLKRFDGSGEHGPHGVRLGPDGLLYVVAGNFTRVPEGLDPRSPHRGYAEDLLLPRNPDGNGFATGVMAPGGWIARTDKDGARWELFCGGFRNAYDIAFSPDGELFTYDSDMEWDTGTPWYRPTRVNHAVSAAEFGWRYGTGKWPAYYADSVGSVVDIGLGSPTGVEFGTGGRFPARYQRALFICDWTHGKLYAVHLQPAGASYTATFETFVEGRPLPMTDVVIHRDGAMYFTTGGRNMQSGLYRVTYAGGEPTAPAGPDRDPTAEKARALRRRLEGFHVKKRPEAVALAWPHLDSADRSIRYAARVAVERQDLEEWKDQALAESRVNARIQALLALTRAGGNELQSEITSRLCALPLEQMSEEQVADALRVLGMCYIRLGGKSPGPAMGVLARLNRIYPSENDLLNRELCQLLVYLESPGVAERSMRLMRSAQTQQDQMFYVFTLRNLRSGWTLDDRRDYFGWLNLAESKYVGGASFRNFLRQVRADALATLSAVEKAALRDVTEGRAPAEAVKLETTRQFVHNWQMDDLLPRLKDVGRGRSFTNGRRAMAAAQCLKCHRFRNEGGSTGPDLTDVGGRFDAPYLLESLLLPSKTISDQYQGTVFTTRDGKVISGRVVSEDARRVLVRTDPFAREPAELLKADIEERQPSKVSEMPQGLVNVLTKDEVLDLIAYLRAGGNPEDAAFRRD